MSDRRRLQLKIHVGCRQLGLDSEARRELQFSVCGKSSMTDMDETDLRAVLDRLLEDGFKPPSKPSNRRPKAKRADVRLVHVLWKQLGKGGALKNTSREGLNAFVRRRFGDAWGSVPADIDMLNDPTQIDQVIQALRTWCDRAGIDLDETRFRR